MSKILNNGQWRECILNAIKAKRCTPHLALGQSPYEIVFGGRKMRPGSVSISPWINRPMQNSHKGLRLLNKGCLPVNKYAKKSFQSKKMWPHTISALGTNVGT